MPSAAARSLFLCIRLVGGTVAEVDRSAVDRSRRIDRTLDARSALASLPGWCFSPFFFFFRERATYEEIGSVGKVGSFFFLLLLLDFSFLRLFGWIFAGNGEGKRVVFLHKGCCDSNFSIIRMNIVWKI